MKIHRNAPQNAAVFSATFGTWQAAKTAVITGTVISIFAEFAISYSLIQQHAAHFITIPAAVAAVMAGVFVAVLAIERIRYGRQAAKLYTDKESRSLGMDANAVVLLVCAAVYGISFLLSYVGSISAATALPQVAIKNMHRQTVRRRQRLQQYNVNTARTARQRRSNGRRALPQNAHSTWRKLTVYRHKLPQVSIG